MKAALLEDKNLLPSLSEKENKIVFRNGVFEPSLSCLEHLPHGVSIQTNAGFHLDIPDKVVIDEIVHLVFISDKTSSAAHEIFSVKIRAGASTRLNLVLHKKGSGVFGLKKIDTEIHLSEGACVDCYQIEEPGLTGEFLAENKFYLKKHAVLDYFVFAASEGNSVSRTSVDFEEEHGFFSAKGLSMLTGSSKADHKLCVNHRAKHCISRQYYKTVLSGSSCASFDSLVHVHQDASKSDSNQLNRNLLLSDFAQARSKPELRIDNDDVSASHGSASGQLDENEIFYLRSRGFSEGMARIVLVDGFAEEMVSEVPETHLKAHLESMIHARIQTLLAEKK